MSVVVRVVTPSTAVDTMVTALAPTDSDTVAEADPVPVDPFTLTCAPATVEVAETVTAVTALPTEAE